MTDPPVPDVWSPLRGLTPARIGLGRAGDAVRTADLLAFEAAHAAARDAVHHPLDLAELRRDLGELGLGEPRIVASLARDRTEYLRRPDRGRVPRNLDALPTGPYDLGIVLADGLAPRAVADHGPTLLRALLDHLGEDRTVAPPVVAVQARVAIGDHIGERLGLSTVLVVIGERPGLSVSDSLGIYLTHRPRPGRLDSERNCVSNIHPRGLGHDRAAAVAAGLVAGAERLGISGVALKEEACGCQKLCASHATC